MLCTRTHSELTDILTTYESGNLTYLTILDSIQIVSNCLGLLSNNEACTSQVVCVVMLLWDLELRPPMKNCYTTGWAKSQFTYVGLNSSATECSIEIILSGMTYYLHWFEKFVKSKDICVHFFQMKVHFRIYLIVQIVGSSQILLDCVWPFELRFY